MINTMSAIAAMTQPAAIAPVLHTGATAPVEGVEPSPHAGSLRVSIAVGQSGLTLRLTFCTTNSGVLLTQFCIYCSSIEEDENNSPRNTMLSSSPHLKATF